MVFSKAWFSEHQRGLLWLLNAPVVGLWFRWVMCIRERKRILELTPNSFTVLKQWEAGREPVFTTDFRTHAKYAKRLYWAFRPFWLLLHALDLIFDLRAPELSFGFSTLTAFPDAGDPGSTSVDGYCHRAGQDESWSTIRSSGGTTHDASATTAYAFRFQTSTTSNQYKELARGFFHYNTSGLGGGATISAADFSLFGNDKQDQNSWAPDLGVYASTVTSNTALADADLTQVGSTVFTDAPIAYSSLSTSAYNTMALNASGLAAISLTGITKLASRNKNKDADNSAPAWASNLFAYLVVDTADFSGTSSDPKLVVTYTAGAGARQNFLMLNIG